MALLKIENVRISGMSVGVPRKVVKTISTTSKYGAEDFVATTGVIEKKARQSYYIRFSSACRRETYRGFEVG